MKNTTFFTIGVLVLTIALFTACPPEPESAHIHQWGAWNVTLAANCTTPGSQTRTCELDATHTETEVIPINPDAHDWQPSPAATAPTCTVDGNGDQVCSYNPEHTQSSTIPKLGHDWNTETGLCNNNCGELYYELGDTGPGGGKIFYVSTEGFAMTDDNTTAHYLEAAPDDMATTLAWASSVDW